MDIIAYIQALLAAGTPTAYACLGILGFFALSILWETLHGLRRGFIRQITHTLFMVAAVVLAFLATSAFSSAIFGSLADMTMEEIVAAIESSGSSIPEEVRGLITSFDTVTLQYLLALPLSTVIIPILFAALFIIINALLKIVYFIICTVLRLKKRGTFRRIGGLLVGAVEGALVASVILLPVAGISSSLDSAMTTLREDNASTEFVSMYDENIAPIIDCPVFQLINGCGGETVMSHFATVYIDGEPQDLRSEFVSGIKIYTEITHLSGVNFKDLSDTDKASVNSLLDAINESDFVLTLISGLLRGLAYSADNGYLPLEVEEPFDKMLDPFLGVFESSEKDNLRADLDTIKEVMFILSDEGVFVAIDSGNATALSNAFTREDEEGTTVIRKISDILSLNPRTKPLVSTITEISVAILCETMDLDGETVQLYESVKDGVYNVINMKSADYETEEEYVEAVSTTLNETLVQHDINLEPEIVDSMAEYISENYKDSDNISDEDIDDVILSYYDSYLKQQKNNAGGGAEPEPDPAE